MKALIQRVKSASVYVDNRQISAIGPGILLYLGIGTGDTETDMDFLIKKTQELRIFENEQKKFDLSLGEIKGEIMIVSAFTLMADCRKGKRPDFGNAAPVEEARKLYELFVEKFRKTSIRISEGQFQAYMEVKSENDGPVTIMLDSKA